jgi:peptidoglycan/LPS O-acetylase OafA/YrhL
LTTATQATSTRPVRTHEIDGLRGWASLMVLLHHMVWESFGVLFPQVRSIATGVLFDGELAVAIFFVLSGEALSSAYFAGRGTSALPALALKRYGRLATPILATTLVVFAVLQLGLAHHLAAAQVIHRLDWLGNWLHGPVSLNDVFDFSLWRTFTFQPPELSLNPFLWTMQFELMGSFIVFGVLCFYERLKQPLALLAVASLLLLMRYETRFYACFTFGLMLCALKRDGGLQGWRSHRAAPWLSAVAVLAVGFIDGYLAWRGAHKFRPALGICLVAAVYLNAPLCAFFSNRLSRWLGKVSFPLYLMQFPVLISLTSGLILWAQSQAALSFTTAMGIGLVSVAVTFVAAMCFEPVERATRWVGDFTVRMLMR